MANNDLERTLYIWNINGVAFANIKANYAKIKHNWDNPPDAQMSIKDFQELGGQVRIIDGKLFYGLTDDEKKQQKIGELEKGIGDDKKGLEETDYVTIKIAEGVATKEDYEEVLKEREELREEIRRLQKELDELKGNSSDEKDDSSVKEDDSGTVEVGDIESGDDLGGEEESPKKSTRKSSKLLDETE